MTMRAWVGRLTMLLGLVAAWCAPLAAQQPSGRVALVIGIGAYLGQAALPTAANDAGLVAQTLTAAGFDVTGARDLDGDGLRRALREFVDKANAAGPDAIAFVYLAGYALQFDGENFFVPVDASLARDSDIPLQAIRVSDFTHALTGLPLQARLMVVDGAYPDPLVPPSDHIAPGLALVDADPGSLVAFNAAPGTVAPIPTGSYGVYGQALAEMMRQGGVPADEVFDRVRLRVNDLTRGAVVPWDSARLDKPFTFLDQAPDAPAVASAQQSFAGMSQRPIRAFPVDEAYSMAVARDTFPAYQDFLAAYPQAPNAKRVRALLALRREALIWRQTVSRNSSAAYWTYLRRYPRGPHVYDSRRRLALIAAPSEPPESFAPITYDVPPPPDIEDRIIERPTVYLDDIDEPPPPPPPVYFLPPEQPDFVDLPPPPPSIAPGFLPIPIPVPVPFGRPSRRPGFIEPPRGYQGQYPQPQPFVTDPGGRLIAQPEPQGRAPVAPFRPDQRGALPRQGVLPGQPGFAPPGSQPPAGIPSNALDGQSRSGPFSGSGAGQLRPNQPGGDPAQPAAAERQRQLQEQQLQQQEQQQRAQQQQFQQRQQQDQQQRIQQQQRQQQEQQQRAQQQQQQRQQQDQQQRLQQQHQQQEQQQRAQQQQFQQRQQQDQQQQQRQQQEQQQRAQQQQFQQRQQQDQQQRIQQQQRQQQDQQQRAQQQQFQQRQQQEQQQRAQQQQFQQRQQQEQQQRAQQQQFQQRQQQDQQQRLQQQQRQQQQQQQRTQQQQPFQQRQARPDCGRPGQPPCR